MVHCGQSFHLMSSCRSTLPVGIDFVGTRCVVRAIELAEGGCRTFPPAAIALYINFVRTACHRLYHNKTKMPAFTLVLRAQCRS